MGTATVPSRRHLHRRHDDIALEVAAAARDVSGQGEAGEAGQGHVVGPADPRLEHSAAPEGHPALDAEVVDAQGLAVAAHPADLHVDDAAGADVEGLAGPVVARDALVEADRGAHGLLQGRVVHEVVVGQGLLDHEEVVGVEPAEVPGVGQGVGRVGVDREQDLGVPLADLSHHGHVGARLDLELDAAIAEAEEAPHPLVEGVHRGLDAQAHPHLDLMAHAADDPGDGLAAEPGHEVHEGQLDARLGHGVALEARETRGEVGQALDLLPEDGGGQVVADDVPRRAHRLVAVERGLPGHAFAPSELGAGLQAQQEEEARLHPPEAHLEGLEQGQATRGAAPGRPGARGRGGPPLQHSMRPPSLAFAAMVYHMTALHGCALARRAQQVLKWPRSCRTAPRERRPAAASSSASSTSRTWPSWPWAASSARGSSWCPRACSAPLEARCPWPSGSGPSRACSACWAPSPTASSAPAGRRRAGSTSSCARLSGACRVPLRVVALPGHRHGRRGHPGRRLLDVPPGVRAPHPPRAQGGGGPDDRGGGRRQREGHARERRRAELDDRPQGPGRRRA